MLIAILWLLGCFWFATPCVLPYTILSCNLPGGVMQRRTLKYFINRELKIADSFTLVGVLRSLALHPVLDNSVMAMFIISRHARHSSVRRSRKYATFWSRMAGSYCQFRGWMKKEWSWRSWMRFLIGRTKCYSKYILWRSDAIWIVVAEPDEFILINCLEQKQIKGGLWIGVICITKNCEILYSWLRKQI